MNSLDSFQTKRLTAERLQQGHFDFVFQMHQDEKVMAYLGGKRTRQQTTKYMEHNISHWDKHGYGIWILRVNETGYFAGRGGLRKVVFDSKEEVEIAYGLMPEFWNKGLATEFVKAVIKVGLSQIGLSSLVCITHPDNGASKRILEKVGFQYEKEVIFKSELHLLYRSEGNAALKIRQFNGADPSRYNC